MFSSTSTHESETILLLDKERQSVSQTQAWVRKQKRMTGDYDRLQEEPFYRMNQRKIYRLVLFLANMLGSHPAGMHLHFLSA